MDTPTSTSVPSEDKSDAINLTEDNEESTATKVSTNMMASSSDVSGARSYSKDELALMGNFESLFDKLAHLSADGTTYTCNICKKTNNNEKPYYSTNAKRHMCKQHALHADLNPELRLLRSC